MISVYARKDLQNVPATGLRTWGYIHDNCVSFLAVVCNIGGADKGTLRPEATAQAIAMWVHAALNLDLGLGTQQNPGFTKVDWEVGPRVPGTGSPDTPLATNPIDPPGEPTDPCDPAAPGGVKPADRWRIDIVVKRATPATIIEVKHYANANMVGNQLNCYIVRARDRGWTLELDGTLNQFASPLYPGRRFKYAVPFIDSVGDVWCTWAPTAASRGHIYFARLHESDPDAVVECGGAALVGAGAVINMMIKKVNEAGVRQDQFPGRVKPVVSPAYRRILSNTQTTYVASVPRHPTRSQELRMDFGDGTSAVRTVAPGSGVEDVSLVKSFPAPGTYHQKINVSDPGVVAEGGIPTLTFEAATDVDPAC